MKSWNPYLRPSTRETNPYKAYCPNTENNNTHKTHYINQTANILDL